MSQKLSVSLPADIRDVAVKAVAEGKAKSLCGFVTSAVREHTTTDAVCGDGGLVEQAIAAIYRELEYLASAGDPDAVTRIIDELRKQVSIVERVCKKKFATFAEMANDPEYNEEALRISEEFAESDWEAFKADEDR